MTLFLASTNPGKLKEFREAAAIRNITVEPVPGLSNLPPCVEDGLSFEDNARKKALYYSRHASGLVIADDSGICVDALDGAPGVHSARFAGPNASDDENNQKLLTRLRAAANPPHRLLTAAPRGLGAAHYVCVIALAEHGRILTVTEGQVAGFITDSPRGTHGFGYDPLFFFPSLGRTFAELGTEEKFQVSHRGAAFRKLLDYVATFPEIRPATQTME